MQEEYPPYAISALLVKKLAGELTPSEEVELNTWVERTPDNKTLYDSILNPENKAERDAFMRELDVQGDWQIVSAKTFAKDSKKQWSYYYKIAATVLILIVAGAALYIKSSSRQDTFEEQVALIAPGSAQAIVKLHNGSTIALSDDANQQKHFEESDGTSLFNGKGSLAYSEGSAEEDELLYNEISVPRGGEYQLILSDGTKVWLNSETQLKFPVRFSKTVREVELTGEAYFEVAHRNDCPFIVSTLQQGKVQVFGTEFNINAYTDKADVWVTLNEGSVSVRRGNGEAKMLKPDQQATLNTSKSDIQIESVSAAQFSAWKDGLLVFENMAFEDVTELLERWYDVQFEFEDESLRKIHFTADIKRYGTFRDVLLVFEKTNQMTFNISGKTILVGKKAG